MTHVLKFEYVKPQNFDTEQPLNDLASWATYEWYC